MIKCDLLEDISELDFTVRTYNALKRNGVHTIADFIVVMNQSQKNFIKFCNKALLGRNSKQEMIKTYNKINIIFELGSMDTFYGCWLAPINEIKNSEYKNLKESLFKKAFENPKNKALLTLIKDNRLYEEYALYCLSQKMKG